MSIVAETNAAISDDPQILQDIRHPACQLAIWQRPLSFDPSPLINGQVDNLRLLVPADNPAPALIAALRSGGFSPGEALNALVQDVSRLCELFRPIANTANIDIRVEIVTGDACRKFHGDYVSARLITTYTGPGTQWLDADDAERVANGLEPLDIHQMRAGDVGIFKGRLSTDRPAIHRSPPIEGTGQARLVTVLNPEPENRD
ncbi:MAG: DUF1826 domain-containing protein [Pseudomonadota bacterium]